MNLKDHVQNACLALLFVAAVVSFGIWQHSIAAGIFSFCAGMLWILFYIGTY